VGSRRPPRRPPLPLAFVTANRLFEQLEGVGVRDEITGRRRDRIFSYTPYVALFRDEPPAAEEGEVQEIEADLP
jgi:hypothetical protein